jgi:PIN domain nuclease of toxin-antitoxin system
MAQLVLLDTCAAIWLVNGDPMSADSRASITAAQTGKLGVYVSPMTAWEVATLVAKNRLQLAPRRRLGSTRSWDWSACASLRCPPRVLIASTRLPGMPPKDPVDRIIAATGRTFGYSIVTRDGELMLYARAGHIDAVGC